MRKCVRLFISLNLSIGLYSMLFVARHYMHNADVISPKSAKVSKVDTRKIEINKITSGVSSKVNNMVSLSLPRTIKSILLWNAADRFESGAEFGSGPEAFVANGCEVTECQIIGNRSDLPFSQYDAVLFNMMDAIIHKKPEEEGYKRSIHQRYVLLSQESPATIPFLPGKFVNFFNWTMSYRLDSDILLVYGRVRAQNPNLKNSKDVRQLIDKTHTSTKNYAKNKTKSVAWMATHCSTNGKRETYVEELKKYIDVDVYGGCGNLSCPRGKHWISNPKCYKMLANTYKFYLSFENSVCNDYVTEKFYEILAHDLVPVVYGGINYAKVAPPHSYINALKYTPQQLAHYLHQIGNNDTLYNEFFWWKEHFTVEAGMKQMVRHAYCDLCKKLHQDSGVQTYKEVKDIWGMRRQCAEIIPWNWKNDTTASNSSLAHVIIKS